MDRADLSALTWDKSIKSSGSGSNCVEVAQLPDTTAIRDSKNPGCAMLVVRTGVFRELIAGIRRGTLDPSRSLREAPGSVRQVGPAPDFTATMSYTLLCKPLFSQLTPLSEQFISVSLGE